MSKYYDVGDLPAPAWEFTVSDFDSGTVTLSNSGGEFAAMMANAKLAEWIAASPVVYGVKDEDGLWFWHSQPGETDTHMCRTPAITPIVKESEERQLLRRARRWIGERHEMPGYSDLLAEIDELLGAP